MGLLFVWVPDSMLAPAKRLAGGVGTAHAVNSTARWGGGGAKEDVGRGGLVATTGGSEEKLTEIGEAAGDVASHEIGVERSRAHGEET